MAIRRLLLAQETAPARIPVAEVVAPPTEEPARAPMDIASIFRYASLESYTASPRTMQFVC